MKHDIGWIVVGAGFTGAVIAERIATVRAQSVLVVERRNHIAGNAFDCIDAEGAILHRYGPHILHTNSDRVWAYLSQFTAWRPYVHKALGAIEDKLVPLPFNLDSIRIAFPHQFAEKISSKLIETFGYGARVTIMKMIDHPDEDVRQFANFVYDNIYKNYIKKQWDLLPQDLHASILARLPVSISHDDRYFQDLHQAVPAKGYVDMFENILKDDRINVALNTDFHDVRHQYPDAKVVYTGPIDAFFEWRFGELPYRSVRFEFETADRCPAQPAATISYSNAPGFTRVTDLSYITGQKTSRSVLLKEFPQAYVVGQNEPYYPVATRSTAVRLETYQKEARRLAGRVWFAGRLGDYAYYNMDQAVGRAHSLFDKQLSKAA